MKTPHEWAEYASEEWDCVGKNSLVRSVVLHMVELAQEEAYLEGQKLVLRRIRMLDLGDLPRT
ncbi:MAG: hypothetical protein ABIL09_16090 [Gemmatimonadota bacterium]